MCSNGDCPFTHTGKKLVAHLVAQVTFLLKTFVVSLGFLLNIEHYFKLLSVALNILVAEHVTSVFSELQCIAVILHFSMSHFFRKEKPKEDGKKLCFFTVSLICIHSTPENGSLCCFKVTP